MVEGAIRDELQALGLHAGAASVFLGDKLLTTPNPGDDHDAELLDRPDTSLAGGSLLGRGPVTRSVASTR